jgi:hypothetical protein
MERKNKIIQVYAVIICIVAVITLLISAASLVSAVIDRSDPIHTRSSDTKLASFENFKMDALKATQKDQAYIPDDETLMKMYESAKQDKIDTVLHYSHRSIVVNSIISGLALILFGFHWWLMKKMARVEA